MVYVGNIQTDLVLNLSEYVRAYVMVNWGKNLRQMLANATQATQMPHKRMICQLGLQERVQP